MSGDHCADCHDWTDEKWEKASAYHEKLAIQHVKKEERKEVKSSFSFPFSGFSSPSVIPIPISNITFDSFDIVITITNASSDAFATTFVTTSLVVSAKPYISHKQISDSREPSRKRKREHSGSSSDLSCDEMRVKFQ